MGLLKSCLKAALAAFAAVVVICLIRTFVLINSSHVSLSSCTRLEGHGFIEVTTEQWQLLKDSLLYKSISRDNGQSEYKELEKLLTFVIQAHPAVFQSPIVSYEIVNHYSLLIHVKGSDSKLLPYLLAGHFDVVPVIESQWSVNPFNATEDEAKTKVYGRGTLDDKASVLAQLTALEFLIKRGNSPKRSFYLAYGHDEEILGFNGAKYIAQTLKSKGVNRLHFLLDEGLFVTRNLFPGAASDVALIGVTEKGYLNVNVSVKFPGGHSSMPGKETAVGILSRAISRLQYNPMPGKMNDIMEELFESMGPKAKFPLNVLFCNLWLLKPVLTWIVENNRNMHGLVRSTTAVTVVRAGIKNNIIPSSVWAVVNHRILPQDTFEKVLEYDRKVINDERITLTPFDLRQPHPISPYDRTSSLPYQVLTDTIEQIFDDAIVAPIIMVASTDTTHYLDFTENVYRFNPFVLEPKDMETFHAEDEAISRDNYQKMMNFYYHLMHNADRIDLRLLSDTKEEL